MALTKCPDCSREVSTKAPTCPACGRQLKPVKSSGGQSADAVLYALLVLGVVFVVIYFIAELNSIQ